MQRFTRLKIFRAELHASTFTRLDDAALAHMRERYAFSHHNNSISGIDPRSELAALMAMFLEERVPVPVSGPILARYFAQPDRAEATPVSRFD